MKKPILDHVGIAVTSLDSALIYNALGLAVDHIETVVSQQVKTAFIPVGDATIELLEPTSPDSAVGKFLEKRGPGIHHLCFSVENLDEELARLQQQGFKVVNPHPVPGAKGKRIAFLHPSAGAGVLIELSEKTVQ